MVDIAQVHATLVAGKTWLVLASSTCVLRMQLRPAQHSQLRQVASLIHQLARHGERTPKSQ
jgi:hypothetical protein